jgi:glucosylceramidase
MLNEKGGPCHVHNPVKSMVLLKEDNYLKTPIYYYVYHISHFASKNSNIVFNSNNTSLNVLTMEDNKKIVIVVMNRNNQKEEYTLKINKKGIVDSINPHSIITYVYQK